MSIPLDRYTQPAIRSISDFVIPTPEVRKLRNGIPLHIIEAGSEDVVRLDFLFEGGRMSQSIPFLSLITNRLLREGSEHYTASEIAEKLDYYGASLELASSTYTEYVTLYSLNKYFTQTVEVVADLLKFPTFPEKELSMVVEANKQQFQVFSQKVEVVTRRYMNQALFGKNHPLGWFQRYEDFDRLNQDLIKKHYRNHYHSGNCSIYISGKVTEDIVHDIETFFGNESWGNVQTEKSDVNYTIETTTERHLFIEQPNAIQSALKIGNLSISRFHPDYQRLRVLVVLLGGYFGSRLMKNIREDKGYTYGIDAGLIPNRENSVFIITTEADNQYIPSVIDETYKEIDRLQQEKVSEKELDMVKNYMLGDFCRSYEGPFSLADAWIYIETGHLSPDFYGKALETIRTVTRDDIICLAQRYLCKENLIEVVAGEKV